VSVIFSSLFHFWQKWHIRGAVSANLGMPECAIIGKENAFPKCAKFGM